MDVGPTLKVKRPEVLRIYSDTIEMFYDDQVNVATRWCGSQVMQQQWCKELQTREVDVSAACLSSLQTSYRPTGRVPLKVEFCLEILVMWESFVSPPIQLVERTFLHVFAD